MYGIIYFIVKIVVQERFIDCMLIVHNQYSIRKLKLDEVGPKCCKKGSLLL